MGIWFMMLGFNLLIPAIMLGAGKLFLKKAPKSWYPPQVVFLCLHR